MWPPRERERVRRHHLPPAGTFFLCGAALYAAPAAAAVRPPPPQDTLEPDRLRCADASPSSSDCRSAVDRSILQSLLRRVAFNIRGGYLLSQAAPVQQKDWAFAFCRVAWLSRGIMRIIRTTTFVVSLLALLGLLSQYATLPESLAKRFVAPEQAALENAISTLATRDPDAANILRSLQDDRDRRAIEAALREQQILPNGDPIRNAESIAHRLNGGGESLMTSRFELARIAGDTDLLPTRVEREAFVVAHGTALDALASLKAVPEYGEDIAEQSASDYLAQVRLAASQPAIFRRTSSDPIAMLLFEEETDEAIRDFYRRANDDRSHPDWLKEVIAVSVQGVAREQQLMRLTSYSLGNDDRSDGPPPVSVGDVVRAAYENDPVFQQVIFDDLALPEDQRRPPAVVVALFLEYGPLIRMAVGPAGNVPRSEILDVIFANEDFIRDAMDRDGREAPFTLVAHFAYLQKSKPGVWREARYSPLALRLENKAPEDANVVLEKYGPDDIAVLLFTGYENALPKATKSVAQFGDLAIIVLQMYSDEEGGENGLFHRALMNPKIGTRIVPYVASKGDQGLIQVDNNIGWLDKYFLEDGTPRGESWLEVIPFVGAPANVVKNLVSGHPNEWGELGWAALDVADTGLLVATFGASAAKSPSQQAAKQTAKSAARQAGKQAAIRGTQAAAATATRATAVLARSQLGKSLLRAGRAVSLAMVSTGRVVTRVWKVFVYVLSASYKAAVTIITKADDIRKAWVSVDQSIRRAVYGGLLTASLYVRLKYKTLPGLPLLGEELGRFGGSLVKQVGETAAVAFALFVDAAFGDVLGRFGRFGGWLAYLMAIVLCGGIAWKACPFVGTRVRYA